PTQTTSYPVIVSDECQTFTVNGSTTVTVVRPTADFYASSPLLFDDVPVTFTNTSLNAVDYFWEFGDGNVSTNVNPSNTYEEPGSYYITLIAIDEKGCRDTVTYPIGIEEAYYVYVPNAFTPDGHRDNSYFSASFYGVDRASVTIFNRWGELIFESNEMDFKWDGTYQGIMQQDGTYTWKITYITNSGREIKIVGHINLLK
ncbi:MAG: T9SS type B sorting domain-containing protein, partial [Bacteroidetes bacterium]